VLIFWKAIGRDKTADWFWLGLVIGAGFLAKFTNGVQLGCIGFFLLWSKEHRRLLFSPKMLVLGAGFGLCILPILWWNMQNGWVHAIALHSRSGVKSSFGIHPLQLLKFIGGQFGVMSPLIMAGIFVAAVALLWKRHADLRVRFFVEPVFAGLWAVHVFQPEQRGQGKLGGAGAGHRHHFHRGLLAGNRGAASGVALGRRRGLCHRIAHDGGDA